MLLATKTIRSFLSAQVAQLMMWHSPVFRYSTSPTACVRALTSAVAFGSVHNFSFRIIQQALEWASPRNENRYWCVRQRGRTCLRCGHSWHVLHPPKAAQAAIRFSKFDAIEQSGAGWYIRTT
jgi:hypothetical protein